MSKPKRLAISTSVAKKLFAYSGNQCAMPGCQEPLVDKSGTMLGKIAHIHAASTGGARFEKSMSDEDRRAEANLFVVCGKHHDIIDDPANEKDYPADKLRAIKKAHEDRFKKAERQFIEQFVDTTQLAEPKYPKTMKAFNKALGASSFRDRADEIRGIRDFIDKLKDLPLPHREFALALARRMRTRRRSDLEVNDVMSAFQFGVQKLKDMMKVLEDHHLGSIDESGYNTYVVGLWEREAGGNPWIEILEFCDATNHAPEEFIHDLNFALYD